MKRGNDFLLTTQSSPLFQSSPLLDLPQEVLKKVFKRIYDSNRSYWSILPLAGVSQAFKLFIYSLVEKIYFSESIFRMEEQLGKLGGTLRVNRYIEQFTSLRSLDLSDYRAFLFDDYDPDYYEPYDQRVLYISTAIRKLTNLRSLRLPRGLRTRKEIIYDDSMINGLIYLTELFLYEDTSQKSLITNNSIQLFTNLTTLRLGLNEESMISDIGLIGLTKLTTLDIDCYNSYYHQSAAHNKITDKVLGTFTNLTSLSLCGMENITDKTFANLTNLKFLNLSEDHEEKRNLITDEALKLLTNLTALSLYREENISNNGISNLINLQILSLRYNDRITDEGIARLTNLIKIDLSKNNLITEVGLIGLPKLMKIYFEWSYTRKYGSRFVDSSRLLRMENMTKSLPNRNKKGFRCYPMDVYSNFWINDLTEYDYEDREKETSEEEEDDDDDDDDGDDDEDEDEDEEEVDVWN